MSNDDIPADHSDDSPTTDATETATDGGAVATEAPQSRFWGVVPTEWELVDGSEVYDVNPSYTPEEEEITYIEMDALDTELPFPKYATKRKAADYSGKLFREGDTLFARITPCTENGKTAFVDEMESNVGIGSTEYAVLSPDRERIHPLYLYYVAKSHPVRNYAISRMRGSTGRQRVPFDVFRKELDVSLPPLEEQEKIAGILFNIDKGIKKTDEIIGKRERVKRGLMQDIFQYGINEHGEIRSDDGDSAAYRETKYGEIPRDWDIVPLNQLVPDDAPIVYGILKPGDHHPNGVPVVKVKDIVDGEIQEDDLLHTAPEIHEDYKRAELEGGDLLFSIRGTVGRTAFVPDSLEGANITQDTARIRVEGANPQYIRYFLETETPNNYFERNTVGQAVQGINLEDLREVPVHLPPEDEQSRIASILDNHTEAIESERKYRSRLKEVKNGLMQDLLEGEVRTKDVSIEIPYNLPS